MIQLHDLCCITNKLYLWQSVCMFIKAYRSLAPARSNTMMTRKPSATSAVTIRVAWWACCRCWCPRTASARSSRRSGWVSDCGACRQTAGRCRWDRHHAAWCPTCCQMTETQHHNSQQPCNINLLFKYSFALLHVHTTVSNFVVSIIFKYSFALFQVHWA